MPELQPEQCLFLFHTLMGSLTNEHGITRRVIEAIPLDKGDYRPDPVSKSALALAWHIVNTERPFLDAVAAGEFDFAPYPMPESIKTSADVVAWYDRMFSEKSAALSQLTGDQLAKIIDFRGVFKLPAVLYLQFVMNHSIHHRGQLSMYLRPMGAKVPAMYGESFDSMEAKKASQ